MDPNADEFVSIGAKAFRWPADRQSWTTDQTLDQAGPDDSSFICANNIAPALPPLSIYNSLETSTVTSWAWRYPRSLRQGQLPASTHPDCFWSDDGCPQVPHGTKLSIAQPYYYSDNFHPPAEAFRKLLRWRNGDVKNLSLPYPLGNTLIYEFCLLGCRLHDVYYVAVHPEKLFTRWLHWYLEISDSLFRHICPADLNDMPCEHDELQGGCPLLRLCSARSKYPHPHTGPSHTCIGETRETCLFLHDIEPTCRSLQKQVSYLSADKQFRNHQLCCIVNQQASLFLTNNSSFDVFCKFGHDFEGARIEALWRYWEHLAQARRRGSSGAIERRIRRERGGVVWLPLKPSLGTLYDVTWSSEGIVSGRTWHGHWVRMTCMREHAPQRPQKRSVKSDGENDFRKSEARVNAQDAGELSSDSGYATSESSIQVWC